MTHVILFYNTIYFLIELVGILYDTTRKEIFRNEKFSYLYMPLPYQNKYMLMIPNQYPNMGNIKNYIVLYG